MDNKDEKEIKKVTRKKKENNENEIKEKLKIEENKPLEKEVFKETKKDVINKNSNKTIIIIVVTALITTAIVLSMFYLFYINKAGTSGKLEFVKNVNITETGIADSVEKVVDSVVVVENYKNGKLISTGTGFVFKKDNKTSYILTNSHVVESGTEYNVIFTNNERVKATLVGNDTYSDVAVLSVDSSKVISVATLGSSERLRVGDTAFTVGAPLDASAYSWTVTRGIISGKNRKVEVSSASSSVCKTFITKDEGMGFAIPIETAIEYANKFINREAIIRPYLGISMYDASSTILKKDGVYVVAVEENSSASKAGLKEGDIITKIDDVAIKNTSYFKYELYKHNVGDTVTLTYLRNNKEHKVTIKLVASNKNA